MSNQTTVVEPRIPDFIGFCIDQKWELPYAIVDENRARTGSKDGLYPPGYFAGQYPALWKTPVAADSAYYQSINKK